MAHTISPGVFYLCRGSISSIPFPSSSTDHSTTINEIERGGTYWRFWIKIKESTILDVDTHKCSPALSDLVMEMSSLIALLRLLQIPLRWPDTLVECSFGAKAKQAYVNHTFTVFQTASDYIVFSGLLILR